MLLEELPGLACCVYPERLDWVMSWGKYVQGGFQEMKPKTEYAILSTRDRPRLPGQSHALCLAFVYPLPLCAAKLIVIRQPDMGAML